MNSITSEIIKYSDEYRFFHNGAAIAVYGLLQPLRYKNKMYLEGTPTPLGMSNADCYLFIAADFGDFDDISGAMISRDGKSYAIDRAERVSFGGETVYVWMIVRLIRSADYPSYRHFAD